MPDAPSVPGSRPFQIGRELSAALDRWSARILEVTSDEKLAAMFGVCMRSTLQDTVNLQSDGTTFVITGDIPAMWLRDSSAQVRPFLRLLDDPAPGADLAQGVDTAGVNRGLVEGPDGDSLVEALAGLVRRQFACIALDSYANAFNQEPSGDRWDQEDLPQSPWVWERKYEVDSLAFPVQLAHRLWTLTGRTDFLDQTAHRCLGGIVDQWTAEQRHENSTYRFERPTTIPTETLAREGCGTPVGYTGMTWSGFRPSDDACRYGYNLPANLFAALTLAQTAELARAVYDDDALAERALTLRAEILAGVVAFGVVEHPEYGPVYAYEVDGLGNHLLMDDANMPSLSSLPLCSELDEQDPVYLATRELVNGPENPYFYQGAAASGIGSPHTPPGYIWPIGLAVRGLTTMDRREQWRILQLLRNTDAGTGRMHEGFDVQDPSRFTRPWFSWADSMFCELLMAYVEGSATAR
ncbi:glycoside hydrolase family 125 protein [Psychromicrobium xiongbiense]|uniref:glycoside hydrolase family 125 protein n=1 Tax=Psychromicrobium xiongbiense TaxID=3051184 RepID=UPI0025565BC6|nr:glycoside hydrolase family 125 protein [Psychromicrobium sp. YIM S02556]